MIILTSEQEKFVAHNPGKHARVLAGPGTGKSVTSIAYLEKIAETHSDLRVKYITFTRAATAEFAQSLGGSSSTLGENKPSTVHGFALGILLKCKSPRIPYPLRIPDSWERKELIHPHLSSRLRKKGFAKATPGIINELETEMASGFEALDPDKMLRSLQEPQLKQAFLGAWKLHRRQFGYVLLSELTYQAGAVLEEVDDASGEVDLLIVDEYQDLNRADIRMLQELTRRGTSVIAIGDDDQSIYGWRMAAPDGIRNFLTEYSAACDYQLSVSRRCGGEALRAANALIQQEPTRPQKAALVASPAAPDTKMHYLKFKDEETEAQGIVKIVNARVLAGVPLKDIVILVRGSAHKWANLINDVFQSAGISLALAADVNKVLGDTGLRYALAVAHLAVNKDDALAWWTILRLTRGVGEAFVETVLEAEGNEIFSEKLLRLCGEGMPKISRGDAARQAVEEVLSTIVKYNPAVAVLDESGWGTWLLGLAGSKPISDQARQFILAVGERVGDKAGLERFLTDLEPIGRELASDGATGVRIMTIAQSKGLTVDTAIVMGVEEGVVPSPKSTNPGEECRLLYVAMTRAKQLTVLTWASKRKGPTARVGRGRAKSWESRESCPLLEEVIHFEPGEAFAQTLFNRASHSN